MTLATDVQNGQSKVDILTRHGIPLEFADRTYRVRPRTLDGDRQWIELVFSRVMLRMASFQKLDALNLSPLTPQEVQAEVDAARVEQRSRNADRR